MVAALVPDDEFVAMVSHANRFRTEVGKLGFSEVDNNVRARLYWNPKIPELSAGHEALANEVHALLTDSRLSAPQAAQLERAYFPIRRPL
jgi:hypothetical protein